MQRLEHRRPSELAGELRDLVAIAGDERAGTYRFGKVLEVGLVDGVGEAERVVDHEHAAADGELGEEDARGHGPGPVAGIGSRVVAHHEDVEVVDGDPLPGGLRALDVGQVRVQRPVVLAGRPRSRGADHPVGAVGEIADPHEPRLVAHPGRCEGEPGGRVAGDLGLDVVDDEADLHGDAPINSLGEV